MSLTCTFTSNKAVATSSGISYGGAVYNSSVNPTIKNSIFWSNSAGAGSQIYGGEPVLI